ncbi:hypothetical protein OHT57_02435 [Streptomyces sp. NBC_00285]|nr:hypothetical protein [Streptomyces sp. NBC_00285]
MHLGRLASHGHTDAVPEGASPDHFHPLAALHRLTALHRPAG